MICKRHHKSVLGHGFKLFDQRGKHVVLTASMAVSCEASAFVSISVMCLYVMPP